MTSFTVLRSSHVCLIERAPSLNIFKNIYQFYNLPCTPLIWQNFPIKIKIQTVRTYPLYFEPVPEIEEVNLWCRLETIVQTSRQRFHLKEYICSVSMETK